MARPNKYPCFDDYYEAKDYAIDHGMAVHRAGGKYYIHPKDEVITTHNKYQFSVRKYVIIAQQLGYPPDIIEELSKSKNETEAENIMAKARHIL